MGEDVEAIRQDIHIIKNNIHQINYKLDELNEVKVKNGGGMVHTLDRSAFVQMAYDTITDYNMHKTKNEKEISEITGLLGKFTETNNYVKEMKDEGIRKNKNALNLTIKWKKWGLVGGGLLILLQMVGSIFAIIGYFANK